MAGWETFVAAVGGVALGFGLGLAWKRREVRSLRTRLYALRGQMRRSVLPVLERRAVELAIPREERVSAEPEDPTALAVTLAEVIRRHEDRNSLPFSDTLDISHDQLRLRESDEPEEGAGDADGAEGARGDEEE